MLIFYLDSNDIQSKRAIDYMALKVRKLEVHRKVIEITMRKGKGKREFYNDNERVAIGGFFRNENCT